MDRKITLQGVCTYLNSPTLIKKLRNYSVKPLVYFAPEFDKHPPPRYLQLANDFCCTLAVIIFTARKVMFLHLSDSLLVILFTGGGVTASGPGEGCLPSPLADPWADTPSPRQTPPGHSLGRYPPPPSRHPPWADTSRPVHAVIHTPHPVHAGIRSTSRRYASYWNVYLL